MNKLFILFTLTVMLFSACDHRNELADAYGNFEADDMTISSEANGKIMFLDVSEGDLIKKGQVLATIDTTQLYLNKQQVFAKQLAIQSQISGVNAQIEAVKQQKKNLQVNLDRIENLLKDGAATQQQKDDLDGNISVLNKQISASKTQIESIKKESDVLNSQIAIINDQIKRATVKSPTSGTILEKFAMSGELTAMGKPLFKLANLNELELKCYISETNLSQIKIGDKVEVAVDGNNRELITMDGKISWISAKAEFTPKTIQTKEERVKLVYAVKIKVQNNGTLKIGMPAEVRFIQ